MRPHWSSTIIIQYDCVPIKRGNLDTEPDTHMKRIPCEDEGRDRGDAYPNQGTPEIASKPPEAGAEAWNRSSLTASEGTHPADTLISDLWLPELWDNAFVV